MKRAGRRQDIKTKNKLYPGIGVAVDAHTYARHGVRCTAVALRPWHRHARSSGRARTHSWLRRAPATRRSYRLLSFSKSREQASRNELLLRENGWKRIHRHAIKAPRGCLAALYVRARTPARVHVHTCEPARSRGHSYTSAGQDFASRHLSKREKARKIGAPSRASESQAARGDADTDAEPTYRVREEQESRGVLTSTRERENGGGERERAARKRERE